VISQRPQPQPGPTGTARLRSPVLLLVALALSCQVEPWEGRNAGECSDDADNDADSLFDCNDPDCQGSPECAAGDDDLADDDDSGDDDSGDDDDSAETPPAFEDRTQAAGLLADDRGTHDAGGRGLAVADIDGDGWPDLYLTGDLGENYSVADRLYRNRGDGSFEDATDSWQLTPPATEGNEPSPAPLGAAFADVDGDGDPDLFLARDGPNQLLRNDGDRFVDISLEALPDDVQRSASAAFADYDGDGDLDLYVVNVEASSLGEPQPFDQRPADQLLRNDGDGVFVEAVGVLPALDPPGAGLAASWGDFDEDGDPDLYLAHDYGNTIQRNQLFLNDGETFSLGTDACSCGLEVASMGLAAGDYDRDDHVDLYVTNLVMDGGEVLLQGQGDGTFVDQSLAATAIAGLEDERDSSWGAQFVDFDRDGWLDLFVAYGSWRDYVRPSPNALLQGQDGSFSLVDDSGVNGRLASSEGAVALDYDLDGCIDLAVQNSDGQPELYRNTCRDDNQWLGFRLQGTTSNRDAVGAVVRLDTSDGPQRRTVRAGSTAVYSSSWKSLHFGIPKAAQLLGATVTWPTGVVEELGVPETGAYLQVIEGQGIQDN